MSRTDPDPRPGDPLTVLRGIGPKSAEALAESGFHTVLDLLLHLPRRYEDRSRVTTLDVRLEPGDSILVRGRVVGARARNIRRRMHIVDGVIDDGRGRLKVVWFNQRWLGKRLQDEPELYLFGTIREARGGGLQIVNPEIEAVADEAEQIVPIYPRIARFGGRGLRRLVAQCLPALEHLADPLPEATRTDRALPGLAEALGEVHRPRLPDDEKQRARALERLEDRATGGHLRLVFDELLSFACGVETARRQRRGHKAPRVPLRSTAASRYHGLLPFELTGAQQRAVTEIARDVSGPRPMARLLQGDVGCGKTVVAASAMAMVLDAGFQVALMAPTELLAEQHHRTLAPLAELGHPPALLVGSLKARERRAVLEGLADGTRRVVVGTHALFQEAVAFHRLGLVVVDEQHRFGVAQRSALADKGRAPHLLVMTATPIPRSLTLTVYGDLDLTLIDELPAGRQQVRTAVRPPNARDGVYEFVRDELAEGGRAYIVCPFIEPNNEIPVASVTEREEEVREAFPEARVGVLHGRLGSEDRDRVTEAFRSGEIQVLLATTVVEVGVDVPEATVMVIESAQHFGLSQLHQLRGRVGRGARQSWCILLTDEGLGDDARARLEVISSTNDGFEIAEADLTMRGPGELTGTRQWGPAAFRFADLVRDRQVIAETRRICGELGSDDLQSLREALAPCFQVDDRWVRG